MATAVRAMLSAAVSVMHAEPTEPGNLEMNRLGFIGASLVLVLALLSSTLFVVDQRQFVVVYQLGANPAGSSPGRA